MHIHRREENLSPIWSWASDHRPSLLCHRSRITHLVFVFHMRQAVAEEDAVSSLDPCPHASPPAWLVSQHQPNQHLDTSIPLDFKR